MIATRTGRQLRGRAESTCHAVQAHKSGKTIPVLINPTQSAFPAVDYPRRKSARVGA